MTIPTAWWQLVTTRLTCGHTMAVRAGDRTAWCSWCGHTVALAEPDPKPEHVRAA